MLIPVGKDRTMEYFGPSKGRTEFQTKHVKEIANREDLQFFCGNPMNDENCYRGPVAIVFYTKDGKIHCHWTGQKRLLRIVEG